MTVQRRPVLCEQARAHVASIAGRPPVWERAIADLRRERLEEALRIGGDPEPVASVEQVRAGGVSARLYRPRGDERAVLVWLHGGAWMLGDLDSQDPVARALANASGCAVLSADYRLAPEHRYPAAIDDAWAVTHWAAQQFDRTAVGGDSSGGNLAAAVALRARDARLRLALQLLVYPVLDADTSTPFYEAFTERYANFADIEGYGVHCQREMRYIWSLYVPDPRQRLLPDASPARASSLKDVAPALILTAEHDLLRGEAEQYARRLEADGVNVTIRDYEGQIHGFFEMLATMDDARHAVDLAGRAVRQALER